MKKYYLHTGTEQEGPFDLDELKLKKVSKDTPVWYEGLTEWTTAKEIEDLKSLFVAIPPPLKKPDIKKPESTTTVKKKSNVAKYILIGLGLFVLVVVGLGITAVILDNNRSSSDNYETKVMSVEQMEQADPVKFLSARGNYNLNFWGDKIKIHGEIVSSATVAKFKDAIIRVTYFSKTKTELGTKDYTIYELITPNSSKHFELKIDNYTNVHSIGCDVIGATAVY